MSHTQSDKARRIARYCLAARGAKLAPETVHEVKRRTLDSVATALGAWQTPVAAAAVRTAANLAPVGEKPAQVMGTARGSVLEYAAFANATMVRTLDYNDTYLAKEPAHPSDNIAAVLATAQVFGNSGADAVLGVANAYEVQCRLCDANSLRAKGIDHVTYGNISAAASCGVMMGMDEDHITHALGIAGVAHTAIRQTREGEMANWKAAAFANADRNALFALRAVRSGFTGPTPIFEGVKGLEAVLTGAFDLVLPQDGEAPAMILKTYIKPAPVEYHAQSAVEVAAKMHREGIDWRRIARIRIRTHKASYEIIGRSPEKWDPMSKETADHSLPYCAAIALIDGPVTLASFGEKKYRDPEILAFLKKIEVVEDPEFTAIYGDGFANHLRVEMQDGTVREGESRYPLGHPKNPMTDAQIEGKFRELADGLLAKAEQDAFIARCWRMESLANLDGFYPSFEGKF
ncbi:MAG: MmgE/PrpD family protein [Candidatus Sumerlaeia bacterium]|nr:MmgE/PrpD family protein [Candidatus Sumerlaeia bacterium]